MIGTSKSKATALNVPCSIAVIGPDGHLLSFERQIQHCQRARRRSGEAWVE
jgi:uncharacterized protein GlcG (DUF336 family)